MNLLEKKNELVCQVAAMEPVVGIAQTGSIDEIPCVGEGDFDILVLCSEIPERKKRIECYNKKSGLYGELMMEVCKDDRDWGTGDILMVDGIETMFMYFNVEKMKNDLDDILTGKRVDREGAFYPIGRLATVKQAHILYEENSTWSQLKEKVKNYSPSLQKIVLDKNLWGLWEEEDMSRAICKKDVVFTHMVFQNSLEHFLQVIYAVNREYFPSWKRSEKYIAGFKKKPANCFARIEKVIALISIRDTIPEGLKEWKLLVSELKNIVEDVHV